MIYGDLNKRYCLTRIAVFEEYELVGDPYYDGKFIAKGEIKHTYNPLEDVDILSKAANLFTPGELTVETKDKYTSFFREFGLLGNVDSHLFGTVIHGTSEPHLLAFREQSFSSGLSSIETSLMGLNDVLWHADINLGRENLSHDSAWLEEIRKNYEESTPDYIKLDKQRLAQSGMNSHTKELVSSLIRKRSSSIESIQVLDDQYVTTISFPTLLDVAYHQLTNALLGIKTFNKCLNCGSIFLAKHGLQKFCAPLPNRKRSTCENTYNQRKKRNKKKVESENK
ncbi:DUF6076 domain-containing protein [Gottfriedia acidiceleris]|uniref:DUF6076 domain-containing protein n=1 Tax=Gottfriedia acidiceleris TaxID=371036 RepID=UPI002FFEC3FA